MARTSKERPSRRYKESRRYRAEVRVLGGNVRRLRHERDWTLEFTEQQTGVDWKHLQKIELGQLNVTLVTIVRIAEGFEVSVSSLLSPTRFVVKK